MEIESTEVGLRNFKAALTRGLAIEGSIENSDNFTMSVKQIAGKTKKKQITREPGTRIQE